VSAALDLRYLTADYLASRGRTLADIADACEVTRETALSLLATADRVLGRSTVWCAGGCDHYRRAATRGGAVTAARRAGWRYDRGRMTCPRCDARK